MDSDRLNRRNGANVLNTFVDAMSFKDALEKVVNWTGLPTGHYVCFCNVHSIVTATVWPDFANTLGCADLVLPDGTPVAWTLRLLGFKAQRRVSGPEFMWKCCSLAQDHQSSVFLYGSGPATLDQLRAVLHESFPKLRIAGSYSPPYRPLTEVEDHAIVERINASGADIVFVSLGCPKQEMWMAAHRDRLNAVMLGVGAAFAYHAGTVQRPPAWMQNAGLEWLCRLTQEPKRLWKRYLIANSIFLCRATSQVIDHTLNRRIRFRARVNEQAPQAETASDRV